MDIGDQPQIRDFAQTLLTLRSDLVFELRTDGDQPGYVIEDPVYSKFYRVGVPEHTFMGLLDGKTTVQEALGITAQLEPEAAFTEEQAVAICEWLMDNLLARTAESRATPRLLDGKQATEDNGAGGWNPWFLQVPLCHPDRFFSRLQPMARWIFGYLAALVAGALVMLALYQALVQWDRFASSLRGITSPDRWIWLALCWLIVKILHEMAHAMVCKRMGGIVREAGIILILMAPVAYVDVSSAWRFRSKWSRIYTAAAGMYAEFVIAALAVLFWSLSGNTVAGDLAVQVALMASVTTLLFNANPLMRFDGYYMLSDFLEIPNLHAQSRQLLDQLTRKYVWGVANNVQAPPKQRAAVLLSYAVAALVWRVLVCISLTMTAAHLFHGAGIVLAVAGLAMWLGPPWVKTAKYFIHGDAAGRPKRLRFISITATVVLLSGLALFYLPWPGAYRAPGLVRYAPSAIIRAQTNGFVTSIDVRSGQWVRQGQPLIQLRNQQLQLDLADLRIQAEATNRQMRSLLHSGKTVDYQVELRKHAALVEQIDDRQQEVDRLTVRAPTNGRIVADQLDEIKGTYVHLGDELLVIGCEDRKELVISIGQEEVEAFQAEVHQTASVRIHGHAPFAAPLTRVAPRAHRTPPDLALTAVTGGMLAVRTANLAEADSVDATRYQFLTPRFEGTVQLDARQSLALLAGQRGVVTLTDSHATVFQHVSVRVRRWMSRLLDAKD